MTDLPRIVSVGAAHPTHTYSQESIVQLVCERVFGAEWETRPDIAERAQRIERLFAACHVKQRQSVVDFAHFYSQPRSTGERMTEYARAAYPLARAAVDECLERAGAAGASERITDLAVVSCTGYVAPGLDIELARDVPLARDVRRVVVGHMGCFGALVGLRQAEAAVRVRPGATALLVSVELCSLHFSPTRDLETLTAFGLFGDAAAALLLSSDPDASGPQLVSTYCAADFATADQMSWTITDTGFMMGLSPRVPITLRRNIKGVMDELLTPQGLTTSDISHWLIHPGGPSILDAIAGKLELSDEQMAPSWGVLADHGNCSSATVLLILDRLMREGRAQPGEWGVMMAFGPGLTLETCLLRF